MLIARGKYIKKYRFREFIKLHKSRKVHKFSRFRELLGIYFR